MLSFRLLEEHTRIHRGALVVHLLHSTVVIISTVDCKSFRAEPRRASWGHFIPHNSDYCWSYRFLSYLAGPVHSLRTPCSHYHQGAGDHLPVRALTNKLQITQFACLDVVSSRLISFPPLSFSVAGIVSILYIHKMTVISYRLLFASKVAPFISFRLKCTEIHSRVQMGHCYPSL